MYKFIKVLIVLPLFFLTACFSSNSASEKNQVEQANESETLEEENIEVLEKDIRLELIDYSNYMYGDMLTYHNNVIALYDGVLQAPDEIFYSTVINKIIPLYSDVLIELEDMENEIKSTEILAVHDLMITAVRTQLDGFLLYKKAYENGENQYVYEGNDKIREANALFITFDNRMNSLLKKYEVKHPQIEQ